MDAVISGRAGVALLLDGEQMTSFDINEPERLIPRGRHDLHFIFGEGSDLKFLEDVTYEQAVAALDLEHDSALALDLTLILLDPDYSDPEVATELEGLLPKPCVLERLERLMFSCPLPRSADLEGAKLSSKDSGAVLVSTFLYCLEKRQAVIAQV